MYLAKLILPGYFFFFFGLPANKYQHLSWSIDRSDSEADDGLRVGAARDMEEDPT